MIGFGFDPDLHHSGWAVVDSDGPSLIACGVIKVPGKFKREAASVQMACEVRYAPWTEELPLDLMFDRVVVEGQQVYLGKKKSAKPADLLNLAYVSGSVIPATFEKCWFHRDDAIRVLKPSEISGVPKPIRQARAFTKLGIPYTRHETKDEAWCVPNDLQGMTKTDWKHVADAVFIALFASTA